MAFRFPDDPRSRVKEVLFLVTVLSHQYPFSNRLSISQIAFSPEGQLNFKNLGEVTQWANDFQRSFGSLIFHL